uniref:Uncharacterized protein n=1 Tax=Neospora caninum (strain Liverpool) TaxID=572307 RepID=A0A0F7UIF3_NEOCL|nr:TPA: hypothetical protein BN1204_055280 [Neospora caninum Liverpool]
MIATKGAETEEEVASLPSTASGTGIEACPSTKRRGAASQICLPTTLSECNSSDQGTMSPVSGDTASPSTITVSAVDHVREAKLSSTAEASQVLGDNSSHLLPSADKVKMQQLHECLLPSLEMSTAFTPFETVSDGKRFDARYLPLLDSTRSALSSVTTSPSGTPSSCRSRATHLRGRPGLSDSCGNSSLHQVSACSSRASSLSFSSGQERPPYPPVSTKLSHDGFNHSLTEERLTALATSTKNSGPTGTPRFLSAGLQGSSSPAECAGAAVPENVQGDELCLSTEDRTLCVARISPSPSSVWATATEDVPCLRSAESVGAGGGAAARCGRSLPQPPQPPAPLRKPATSSFPRSCGLLFRDGGLNTVSTECGSPMHKRPTGQRSQAPLGSAATLCCVATARSPKHHEGQFSSALSNGVHISHDGTVGDACYTEAFDPKCRQHKEGDTTSIPEALYGVGEATCVRENRSGAASAFSGPLCGSKASECEAGLQALAACRCRDALPTGDVAASSRSGSTLHVGLGRMATCCCGSASAGCVPRAPRLPPSPTCPCCHGQPASAIPAPPPSERHSFSESASGAVHSVSCETATVHPNKRSGATCVASGRFSSLTIEARGACVARHLPPAVPMPALTPVPVSFPPTASSAPVSLLLTLPLNLPFGRIIKFGVPSALANLSDSGASQPALMRNSFPLRKQRVADRGRGDGNGIPSVPTPPGLGSTCTAPSASAAASMRSLGAKKSYYCFSPLLHEAAYTLLSHAGGICDTFAASLHLELAILYLPPAILPWVGAAFNHLAATLLPRFDEPLKLECGGLQERNAPGRLGGKVLTVGCAIRQAGERQKFQRMQEFLSQFEREVENLLRAYALQHPTSRARGSHQVAGACGEFPGRDQEGMTQAGVCGPKGHHTSASGEAGAAGPFEFRGRTPEGSAGPQSGDGSGGPSASAVAGSAPSLGGSFGRKHNIWRYSMGCVPSSVLPGSSLPLPPPDVPSSDSCVSSFQQPGWQASCPASGSSGSVSAGYIGAQHLGHSSCTSNGMQAESTASAARGQTECGSSTRPLAVCCEGVGSSGGAAAGRGLWGSLGLPGGCLDLTVRAFETRALEKHPREYARLVVRDICVSEVRLVTTRGIPGITCEIDPRFEQYSIGTRPILTTPDGQLCRHSVAPHWLSDIWEVRLKTQAQLTREQQKRLVEQYVVGEIERRPQAEQRRLLDTITRLGAALWVNGRPAGAAPPMPPPPLPVKVPDPPRPSPDFQNVETPSARGRRSTPNHGRTNTVGLRDAMDYGGSLFSDKVDKDERVFLQGNSAECARGRCTNRDIASPQEMARGDLTMGPLGDEVSPGFPSCFPAPPRFPSDLVPRPGGPVDEDGRLRGGERWVGSSPTSRESHLAHTLAAGAAVEDRASLDAQSPTGKNTGIGRANGSTSFSANSEDIADRGAVEERLFQLSLSASQRSRRSARHSEERQKPYRRSEDGVSLPRALNVTSNAGPIAGPSASLETAALPSPPFQTSNHAVVSHASTSEKLSQYGPPGLEQRSKEDRPSYSLLQVQPLCDRQSLSGRTVPSFPPSPEAAASSNRSWGSILSDCSTRTSCGSCTTRENDSVGTEGPLRTAKASTTGATESCHLSPSPCRTAGQLESGAPTLESWSQRLGREQDGDCILSWNDERVLKCPQSQEGGDFSEHTNVTAAASLLKQLLATSTHAFKPYGNLHKTFSSTEEGIHQPPAGEVVTVVGDENRGLHVAAGSATHSEVDDLQQLLLCEWFKEGNSPVRVTEKDAFPGTPKSGENAVRRGMREGVVDRGRADKYAFDQQCKTLAPNGVASSKAQLAASWSDSSDSILWEQSQEAGFRTTLPGGSVSKRESAEAETQAEPFLSRQIPNCALTLDPTGRLLPSALHQLLSDPYYRQAHSGHQGRQPGAL